MDTPKWILLVALVQFLLRLGPQGKAVQELEQRLADVETRLAEVQQRLQP